jgi:autotransporter-associated beta strand protein
MNKPTLFTLVSSVAVLLASPALAAPVSWSGAADSLWNTPGNWVGGSVPTAADVAVFDLSSTANLSTQVGAPLSIGGVQVATPAGPVGIGGPDALTLGASGINLATATQDLAITAPLVLAASQPWNVAAGRTLTVSGGVSRTGPVFITSTGAGTVDLTGVLAVDQLLVGNGALGGTVRFSGAGSAWTQAGTPTALGLAVGSAGGTGAVELSGGTHTFGGDGYNSAVRIGTTNGAGNVSSGSVTISGATVKVGMAGAADASINLGVAMAAGTSGAGTLTITSGLLEVGRRILIAANNTNMTGTLNLSGTGTIEMKRTGSNAEGDLGMLRIGSGTATLNLDGGTLIASAIHTGSAAAARTTINYNGTTIRANVTTTAFITAPAQATQVVKAGGFIFDTNTFDVTYGGALANAPGVNGPITKLGLGTLSLTGANTANGVIAVNDGTLAFSGGGTIGAGAAVQVGPAGILRFNRNDTFGTHTANVTQTITVNGGKVTNGNTFTTLGAINLNGGTIESNGGANANFPSFSLKGPITVGGTAPSLITGTGTNSQMLIGNITAGSQTIINVADVTSSSAADLTISVPLDNNRNAAFAAIPTGLVKDGPGTLSLTAANTFTGIATVNGGALSFAGAGTLGAGASMVVEAGGTLRFDRSDTFGNHTTAVSQTLTLNGGKGTNGNTFNTLGAINLNGGTLESTGGTLAQFPSFSLKGPVTVGGSAPSTITGTGVNSQMLIGNSVEDSQTLFTVADVTASPAADLVVSVPLQNNVTAVTVPTGLLKSGAGTMTLSAVNTYTGRTSVDGGLLNVDGNVAGNAEVLAGGSLGGTGAISGSVRVAGGGAIIAEAAGLDIGPLTMEATGSFQLKIDTTTLANSGRITIAGGLDLALTNEVALVVSDLAPMTRTQGSIPFITYANAGWSGALFHVDGVVIDDYDPVFNAFSTAFEVSGNSYRLDYDADGNNVALIVVPEPVSGLCLLTGAGLLLGMRRRRQIA